MRPSFFAVPLLLASTSLARSPLKRGQITDTCANLDADLVFSDVEVNGKAYNAGHIRVGLCVSQVDVFVYHYDVTEAAAKVVGVDRVKSAVIAMIQKAGAGCTYPPHAKPAVTGRNECDFVCMDGFVAMPSAHPSSCVCPPNLMECNGKCTGSFAECEAMPPLSRRENEPKCGKDLTMCGVPDATSGQAFKCTDVTSDSYTCGGCVKASPFGSSSVNGVNCHDISDVDEVSCKDKKCFVRTCKSGFIPSASNDKCVAVPGGKTARDLPVYGVHRVVDAAMRPVHAVTREESSGMTLRGSVEKEMPRSGGTLRLARSGLGKIGSQRLKVAHDIPGVAKVEDA